MDLKALRESYGISRKDLAEQLNIPYRTVQNWELSTGSNRRGCPIYILNLIEFWLKNKNNPQSK